MNGGEGEAAWFLWCRGGLAAAMAQLCRYISWRTDGVMIGFMLTFCFSQKSTVHVFAVVLGGFRRRSFASPSPRL